MNKSIEEKYILAGKIAKKAREYGIGLIKVGANLKTILDNIQDKIEELGGELAFPPQVSVNNVAAHYCADFDEETVFEKNDICKLDLGVHIDGYIADTAETVYLGEDKKIELMVEASREALNAALKLIKPGVTLGEIGRVISEEIESRGFQPIRNLSGHGLGQYKVHSSPTIPNYDTTDDTQLVDGQVIAIEPFATNGKGMIYETEEANIFAVIARKPVRSMYAREILKEIQIYNGLPFTTRNIAKKLGIGKTNLGLKELIKAGIIRGYPPLLEQEKGFVSQAEHTIIVKEKPIITTL